MNIAIGSTHIPYNSKYFQGSSAISPSPYANGNERDIRLQAAEAKDLNDPGVRLDKRLGLIDCKTCSERKYQDGSDDPGVSFKTPAHISPESSGAVVMSHELEHVRRESAEAQREGRKVLAQSVRLETSVCPECGKIYVSGGQTTTVTKSDDSSSKKDFFKDNFNKSMSGYFGRQIDIKV